MKIGELSTLTGLATSAIRFYEASGLLTPPERGPNGYRVYGEGALRRLQLIQLGQRLGFGLEQMRELFAASVDGLPHDAVMAGLNARLMQIEELLADLQRQKQETLALREQLQQEWDAGRCLDPGRAGITLPVQKAAVRP